MKKTIIIRKSELKGSRKRLKALKGTLGNSKILLINKQGRRTSLGRKSDNSFTDLLILKGRDLR